MRAHEAPADGHHRPGTAPALQATEQVLRHPAPHALAARQQNTVTAADLVEVEQRQLDAYDRMFTSSRVAADRTSRRMPATAKTAAPAGPRTGCQTTADLSFLARTMKAPALLDAAERLAERALKETWTHTEFLVACLQREVSAREYHGGEARIRSARFPAIKTVEELDVTHLRGITRQQLAHLGTLDFIAAKENAVFLGPPGTGKTHPAIGLAVRAC
ncbi:ATP-binding protein [Streptomyces fagopyri]|uniref:ATP-binding protein n=1 Tax=Streptomyces fagopyri TaxID=2662397 RepID=UPI0033FC797E